MEEGMPYQELVKYVSLIICDAALGGQEVSVCMAEIWMSGKKGLMPSSPC